MNDNTMSRDEELYHNTRLYLQRARAVTDVGEIIKTSSLYIGRPIAIIGLALKHLGHYPEREFPDHDWNNLIKNGHLHENYAREMLMRKEKAHSYDTYDAYHTCSTDTELEKCRCSLFISGKNMGGMMILAHGGPFSEEERDHIELARMIIAEFLLIYYHSVHAFQSKLLEKLESDPTPEVIRNVLQHTSPDGAIPANGFISAFCLYGEDTEWYISLVSYVLASRFPGTLITNGNDGYYYLVPLHRESYAGAVEYIREHMQSFPEYFAISDCFSELSDFPRQLASVRHICRYSAANLLPVRLQTAESLRRELFLERLAGAEKSEVLCHPDVQLLRRYDRENGTRYCSILYEYLRCFHNLSLAAEKLFIHRNTLSYHLNNIKQLVSCDIEDPDTAFLLLLSLCV